MQLGRMSLLAKVKYRLQKGTSYHGYNHGQEKDSITDFCITSANTVVELILELQSNGQLAFFSHTDLQSCSSAITLLLLAKLLDPGAVSSMTLQAGLGVLESMGQRSKYANSGYRLLRQLYDAVESSTSSSNPQQLNPSTLSSHHVIGPRTDEIQFAEVTGRQDECHEDERHDSVEGLGPQAAVPAHQSVFLSSTENSEDLLSTGRLVNEQNTNKACARSFE